MKLRFSILVPVYNVQKYLPECLEAIENQTYRNFEVVLVDDGSDDKSGEICDQFKRKSTIDTTVIHKDNEGLISARRIGIKNAKGEYCIFCDSDDFLEKKALENINEVIEKSGADLIIYNANSYKNNTKVPFFQHVLKEGIIEDKSVIYDEYFMSYRLNAIWLKAVKKAVIDVDRDYSNFYWCNYGEDLLQSVPITMAARKIYYLDKALYNYRVSSGMMSHYHPNYYWSYKKVNLEIRKSLQGENIKDFEQKAAYHLLVAAYGAVTQFKYVKYLDSDGLEEIRNDKEFQKAYEIVEKSFSVNLCLKHKLILNLLQWKKYRIIWILLKGKLYFNK